MNTFTDILTDILNAETSPTVFISRYQHERLEEYLDQLFQQNNVYFLLGSVFSTMQMPLHITQQTDAARRYYLLLYFAMSALKTFPSFFHANDQSDYLLRKFQQKKKAPRSDSYVENQSQGGFELLIDFVNLALSALEFVRENALMESPESCKLRQKQLYGNRDIGQVYYDNSLFQYYCDFNVDLMLCLPVKMVYHAALDVIGLIRNKQALHIIKMYLFEYLVKGIACGIHREVRRSFYNFVTRECQISYYIFNINVDILIAGGILSAFGSSYANSLAFYLRAMIANGTPKDVVKEGAKQGKDGQFDVSCLREVFHEYESKVLTLFQTYFGLETVQIGSLCEVRGKEISTIQDILLYDAFHYLVCQLMAPLINTLGFYQSTSDSDSEFLSYSYYLRTYVLDTKFQMIFNYADVSIKRTEENQQFYLNYVQLFQFMLTCKDGCREPLAQHTVSQFLGPLFIKTQQVVYELILDKLDYERYTYEQPIFEAADLLYACYLRSQKDVFTPFLEMASQKGKTVCAWIAVFRAIYLIMNCMQAEKSVCLLANTNSLCYFQFHSYDLIYRNSYFPTYCYCAITDTDMEQITTSSKTIEQISFYDGFMDRHSKNLQTARQLLIQIIVGFIKEDTFAKISNLSIQSSELSFYIIEGFLLTLQAVDYFSVQKPNYISLCNVFNNIFTSQALEVEQAYLLRQFINLAPETQIVFLDSLGIFALGYDPGTSLIMQNIAEPSISQQDQDYDYLQQLIATVTNNRLLSDNRLSVAKPFDFLAMNNNNVKKFKMIANIFVHNDFDCASIDKIVVNCKKDPMIVMRALNTSAWLFCYLIGECTSFRHDTAVLASLSRLLRPSANNIGFINQNLAIYDRTSQLKKALLTMFSTATSKKIETELLEIGRLSHDVASYFDLDSFGVFYEQHGMFSYFSCNQLMVYQFFISSVFSEVNSDIYSVNFKVKKGQVSRRDIKFEQLIGGLPLSPLNANYLLRSAANMQNIAEISDQELCELQRFTECGFAASECSVDLSAMEKLLSVYLLIVYYYIGCQRFLVSYNAEDGRMLAVCRQLVGQVLKLTLEVVKYCYHVAWAASTERPCVELILVCMLVIRRLVGEYEQHLRAPAVWLTDVSYSINSSPSRSSRQLTRHAVFVDALARFYALVGEDRCRESILLALRELLTVLPYTAPSRREWRYSLDFVLSVHHFERFSRAELATILGSPLVQPLSVDVLARLVARSAGGENGAGPGANTADDVVFAALEAQRQCGIDFAAAVKCDEESADSALGAGQYACLGAQPAALPRALVFALAFCERYKEAADYLFDGKLLYRQRLKCSTAEVQLVRDLAAMYEALSPSVSGGPSLSSYGPDQSFPGQGPALSCPVPSVYNANQDFSGPTAGFSDTDSPRSSLSALLGSQNGFLGGDGSPTTAELVSELQMRPALKFSAALLQKVGARPPFGFPGRGTEFDAYLYNISASAVRGAQAAQAAPSGRETAIYLLTGVILALYYLFASLSIDVEPAANELVNFVLSKLTVQDALFAAGIYTEEAGSIRPTGAASGAFYGVFSSMLPGAFGAFGASAALGGFASDAFATQTRSAFSRQSALRPSAASNPSQPLPLSRVLALLFPALLCDSQNASFVQTSHTQSYFAQSSAAKCCICVLMQFLAAPCAFFSDFHAKAVTKATENAFALVCLSMKDQAGNLVFYEYLFKQKLNYAKEFNAAPQELLYDNLLDNLDEKIGPFSLRGQQKDHAAVFKELRNNVNAFLFSGVCSAMSYYNCDMPKIEAMSRQLAGVLNESVQQNDALLMQKEPRPADAFATLVRACLDYTGCAYSVNKISSVFHAPNLAEISDLTEVILQQIITNSLQLQSSFSDTHYYQGNTSVFRARKQTLDSQFIEQTFQILHTDQTLKDVECVGKMIEQCVLESVVGLRQIPDLMINLFSQKTSNFTTKLVGACILAALLTTLRKCDYKCRFSAGILSAFYNITNYLLDRFTEIPKASQPVFVNRMSGAMAQIYFEQHQALYGDVFTGMALRLRKAGGPRDVLLRILQQYAYNEHVTAPELILVKISQFVAGGLLGKAYKAIEAARGFLIIGESHCAEVQQLQAQEDDFSLMFAYLWQRLLAWHDMLWICGE